MTQAPLELQLNNREQLRYSSHTRYHTSPSASTGWNQHLGSTHKSSQQKHCLCCWLLSVLASMRDTRMTKAPFCPLAWDSFPTQRHQVAGKHWQRASNYNKHSARSYHHRPQTFPPNQVMLANLCPEESGEDVCCHHS